MVGTLQRILWRYSQLLKSQGEGQGYGGHILGLRPWGKAQGFQSVGQSLDDERRSITYRSVKVEYQCPDWG